ncbi:S-adenosyl-L-methionine-dependent methyltransferase [Cenococcum geophilum 1.58]|uniref:S-adenosyl-L-methionine-dependent methyltransferase n=1 Tax=Cenococcum geophilum 1.58 TaxID=794803 RepID=A0ACC8EL57_9PEZI|nr:S-adenosyl-L-methionine-dependent methyltransferase [Cenococcum geophilum 1.58]
METLKDVLQHLIFPWLFMSISSRRIPYTIRTLISEGRWQTLFCLDGFCDALFGNFWAVVGPQVKSSAEVRVIPLLEGRVRNAKVSDHVVGKPVSGRILEIGAGTGMWADVFLRIDTTGQHAGTENANGPTTRRRVATRGISKIYGVEPHAQSVKALRQRTKELGMEDMYEAIPVGIEQLDDPRATGSATTIEPGSIDCIVSILCLCSIPDQEKNIKALYKLLKPGGRWYVYEHVKVKRGGILLGWYQRYINFFWAFFLGSCRLCHDTTTHLKEAGPWSSVDLAQPPDEPAYKMLPHILGVLTK